MTDTELTYLIRGAAFKVHSRLGPGLLESVYEKALLVELHRAGLNMKCQLKIPVLYDGIQVRKNLRIDILVNDIVIVEIKSVERLNNLHIRQVITYLKITGKKIGFLINFNSVSLDKSAMIRIVNGF